MERDERTIGRCRMYCSELLVVVKISKGVLRFVLPIK